MHDRLDIADRISGAVSLYPSVADTARLNGIFSAVLYDETGTLVRDALFPNAVVDLGANLGLDTLLSGANYTVTGPYMGIIGADGYTSGVATSDTMTSHGGWAEAGGAHAPTYSGGRLTCAWSAAASRTKMLSAFLTFTFTGSGTVKGLFICLGSGATNVVGSTTGTLFSAGLMTGGDMVVQSGYKLEVNYQVSQ